MNEIASFQIDSEDLLNIYVCMFEYRYIIKKESPEGANRIDKTLDKIWNQLTKNLKAKIDPCKYDKESWIEAKDALDHRGGH